MADRARYNRQLQQHRANFGPVGIDGIKAPEVPEYLALWFELQRWEGHLLVEGGLLDQPAWTWELIDLAGLAYLSAEDANRQLLGSVTGQNDGLRAIPFGGAELQPHQP